MAQTNYIIYRWLINLLKDEADERHGLTLEYINREYETDMYHIYSDSSKSPLDMKKTFLKEETKEVRIKPNTFLNWRYAIYKQFGLIIQQPIRKNITENRYYIANREILEKNFRLLEIIDHLAEDEKRGYEAKTVLTVSIRGRKPKVSEVAAMGFISGTNQYIGYDDPQFGYQYTQEPETVGMIQFSMALGEALVIKKSKENFVFESQQLVCINDRWYVAGYSYKYGETDPERCLTVYDVESLQLAEEEDIINPHYQVQDGFDIYSSLPADWNENFNNDKVMSLYLRAVSSYLDSHPFCQAQEKIDGYKSSTHNLYKVYIKPDRDFFVQYMAYGDEVRVFCPYKEIAKTDLDISEEQITYLNKLRKQGL